MMISCFSASNPKLGLIICAKEIKAHFEILRFWVNFGLQLCRTRTSIIQSSYFNPSRPDPRRREKINLYFYFHTSLWCLKRFYEDHKPFWGSTKKCKTKSITFWKCTGREGLIKIEIVRARHYKKIISLLFITQKS